MHLDLTRATDLALRALRTLHRSGARMKRPALAAEIGTTPDFLARVVGRLVGAGWVESEPGRNGGYLLVADPEAISVLDVIEAVEGPAAGEKCVLRGGPCRPSEVCAVHDAWTRAREGLIAELAATPAAGARVGS